MQGSRKIWLIVIGEPLPLEANSRALRTRILAKRLSAMGHDVTWWTSDFNHFSKSYHPVEQAACDSGEGYQLRFLHGRAYQSNLSINRFRNHVEIAHDFSAQSQALESPDIIVCCFPSIELTREAVAFANLRSIPIIVDVRDLWPDEIRSRIPRPLRSLGSLLLSPLDRQVRKCMRDATALVGVSRNYLDWALAKADRAANSLDCVIPLGYPDSEESQSIRKSVRVRTGGRPINFFFSGSFNHSVDLDCLISAFKAMPDANISATLCGDGDNFERWRTLAAGDRRISFTGWIQSDEIRRHAAQADVGVICYRPESLVAMPNKLFEYLSFGLPVINSIPGEAASLVSEESIGLNYQAGSVSGLRDAMLSIFSDDTARIAMAMSASRCFELSFSADAVYQRFSNLLLQSIDETLSLIEQGSENE